jgi:hypothetical protein
VVKEELRGGWFRAGENVVVFGVVDNDSGALSRTEVQIAAYVTGWRTQVVDLKGFQVSLVERQTIGSIGILSKWVRSRS